MYWNRFDIVMAYYAYFTEYHRGQGSREYRRLSKLLGYFKPSFNLSSDTLEDNAREIFDNLVAKYN
jgi:hypothetical protein